MMKRWLGLSLIFMLCAALTLAGCGQEEAAPVENDPDSTGVGQLTEVETVYIGVLLPLSGSQAAVAAGNNARAAMEVAADVINNSHDIDWELAQAAGLADYGGAKVELRFADCGTTTAGARQAVKGLMDLGVVAVLGCCSSDMTAAVALACAHYGVPMISGSAKDYRLTDGSYDLGDHFYRIGGTDAQETALFLDFLSQLSLRNNLGVRTVAIAYMDNEAGRHAEELLEEAVEASSFTEVAVISYAPDDKDLADEAAKIVNNQPDAIFQIGGVGDTAAFVNAYAQTRYQPKAVICYGAPFQNPTFAAAVNGAGADFYYGAVVSPDTAYADGAEAAEKKDSLQTAASLYTYINGLYQAKTGVAMDNSALLEFAAVIVAAQAVSAAGTTDSAAFAEQLQNNIFAAPYLFSGTIDFGENGQNTVTPSYPARLTEGRYAYAL
ncbi:MAG: ABC transporter substrate-binding protein [Firmicutes bacterium]|nr:ABC transporter substrate-binding protein [Bacillota bacterium]